MYVYQAKLSGSSVRESLQVLLPLKYLLWKRAFKFACWMLSIHVATSIGLFNRYMNHSSECYLFSNLSLAINPYIDTAQSACWVNDRNVENMCQFMDYVKFNNLHRGCLCWHPKWNRKGWDELNLVLDWACSEDGTIHGRCQSVGQTYGRKLVTFWILHCVHTLSTYIRSDTYQLDDDPSMWILFTNKASKELQTK